MCQSLMIVTVAISITISYLSTDYIKKRCIFQVSKVKPVQSFKPSFFLIVSRT